MANIMTVLAGTEPGAPVPLVAASFLYASGTSIDSGWIKVKKRTFEDSCCQGNSFGSQSAVVPYPSSVSSARSTYSPMIFSGQAACPASATTGAITGLEGVGLGIGAGVCTGLTGFGVGFGGGAGV